MKIAKTFTLDSDNAEWLKSKGNMSEFLDNLLYEARRAEIPKKKPKLITCPVCGAEYADILPECPGCLHKKNKELTEKILTAHKEEQARKEAEEQAEQFEQEKEAKLYRDLERAKELYKVNPELVKKTYSEITDDIWDFTEADVQANPSVLLTILYELQERQERKEKEG